MISKIGAVILTIISIIGLYFGLNGICTLRLEEELSKLDERKEELMKIPLRISIEGRPPTENKYEYQYIIRVVRYERIFPLIKYIPSFLGFILTAMFFSLLGAITRILLGIARKEYSEANPIKYISEPLLGLFTGICVLGIAYVLPTILVFNSDSIRSITLMFFSLFCGLHARQFFEKVSKVFLKLFN